MTYLVILGVAGLVVGGFVWLIRGFFNDSHKRRDEADQEWAKAMQDKRESDNELLDDDYRQRLFDEDNKD